MQESADNQSMVDLDLDEEQYEVEPRKSNPWKVALWVAIVVILIIGFTCFGLYTLMHIPPQPDDSMVRQVIALIP